MLGLECGGGVTSGGCGLVDALPLADQEGEDERNGYGDCHAERVGEHGLGLHGEDAGKAADADGIGRAREEAGEQAGARGADHAADEREDVLDVYTEDGRLGDAQIAGEGRGDVYLLGVLILLLQDDHGKYRRALGDV